MSVIKTQICRTSPPRSANLCPDITLTYLFISPLNVPLLVTEKSRTPPPHAAATAAAFVVTAVHRSRRCPSRHHRSSRAAAHLLLSNRIATIHRDCAAAVRDRRCRPYRAASHCAASSSALASAWALTLGVGVGHCRRGRDVHRMGRLRLVCIVVRGEGGGGSVSRHCQGACVLVAAGREGGNRGSGGRAVALSGRGRSNARKAALLG